MSRVGFPQSSGSSHQAIVRLVFDSMTRQIAALLLAPAFVFAAAANNSTGKKTTQATAKSSAKSSATRARYKGRAVAKRKPAGPSYQTHPTPDRYKEIQQTLADKGYFKGEVNGTWGDDSVDALKRFQSEHQLPDDGKINSLSLIQLGLGPKHNSSDVHPGAVSAAPPPLPSVTEAPPETTPPDAP
jgi:peptidoglycan hydrolase-like protein with peptidoglycan-binding domain